MVKHPKRILWLALIVAWSFDFLFWKKSPGVSFAIFITIVLCTGIFLAWQEKIKPAKRSLWLLIVILTFACWTFIRKEPFTYLLNIFLTFMSMGIFAHTFLRGRWIEYSISDYFASFFYLAIDAFKKPIEILTQNKPKTDGESGFEKKSRSKWERGLPYLRGFLIAIPIVVVFASLFAAADPIFADYLENFMGIFRFGKLPEYIFRGVYICILGYLLAGIYLHAITSEKEKFLIGEEKPWMPKFLGFPETIVVLGSVELLFSLFVGIQFRYFFGGQSNINLEGFTYAEYARRGFGELVVVSVISLFLFLGLSAISKRNDDTQQKTFSGLGVILVLLVIVILFSAFQRLWLYEKAYGFTRLRTYSHLFMVWLGVLLVAVIVLEVLYKQRAFALASFLTVISFVLSLNLINVDRFIIDQNVKRALNKIIVEEGGEGGIENLDTSYFYLLSSDAIPALIQAYKNPQLSEGMKNELSAVLACNFVKITERRDQINWQSFHISEERARHLLTENRDVFRDVRVYQKDGSWWVIVNGVDCPCEVGAFGYD